MWLSVELLEIGSGSLTGCLRRIYDTFLLFQYQDSQLTQASI